MKVSACQRTATLLLAAVLPAAFATGCVLSGSSSSPASPGPGPFEGVPDWDDPERPDAEFLLEADVGHLEQVRALEARREYQVTGDGVTVAVVDSGFERRHLAFREDAFDVDASMGHGTQPPDPFTDTDGHGTHVASLVGGYGVGVAPGTTLHGHALQEAGQQGSFTGESVRSALAALIDTGPDVANFSLSLSATLIENAQNRDFRTLFAGNDTMAVISAGNQEQPTPLASAADDPRLRGQLLVAGGVDSSGAAQFASACVQGDCDGLGRIERYVSAPSGSAGSEDPERIDGADAFDLEGWRGLRGTSASAPIVAGGAALVRERFDSLSAAEVVDLIVRTADDDFEGYDPEQHGAGILDLVEALAVTPAQAASARVALSDNVRMDEPDAGLAAGASVLSSSPVMGDALAGAGVLAHVLAVDDYGRPIPLDLRGALRPPVPFDHAQALAEMTAPGRMRTDAEGRFALREGGRFTFGGGVGPGLVAESGSPAGMAMTRFRNTEPYALETPDRRIGPSAPLHARQVDTHRTGAASVQGGMIHFWRDHAFGRVQLEGWHRRVESLEGAQRDDAVGARVQWSLHGGPGAVRVAAVHDQRPDRLGLSGRGALALGEGGHEQALELAGEVQLGAIGSVYGQARLARVQVETEGPSLIAGVDGLRTLSSALGYRYRHRAFEAGVRVTLPERAESGEAVLRVPTDRDRAGRVQVERSKASLTPDARARHLEVHVARDVGAGRGFVSLIRQQNPGHRSGAPTEQLVLTGLERPF